jgi:putative oxidoreductase
VFLVAVQSHPMRMVGHDYSLMSAANDSRITERTNARVTERVGDRGAGRIDAAILFIRVASGLVFLYHGSGILWGAFGGPGPQRFAATMHGPTAIGYLVGLAEFCGGLAMLTGLFVRVGAVCIIVVMLGAIFRVHLKHGFDVGHGGMEYALTELLIGCAVLVAGSGRLSLSRWLPSPLRKL